MKPFLPVFLWALIILALSIGPSVQVPGVILSPDKVGHFVFYGILMWLTARALRVLGRYSRKAVSLAAGAICGYGVLLELVQRAFFPNRFFDLGDIAADAAGVFIAVLAFHFFIIKT